MRLRFLGTDSERGTCPTLYETDRGTIAVQGYKVADPQALADVRSLAEDEDVVEVPRELLRYADRERTSMSKFISDEEFDQLFVDFEHTAWKLEVRDRYAIPQERETLQRFLTTGDIGRDESDLETSWWHRNVVQSRKEGKIWQRVRVVTEPLSNYIRWEHAVTRYNNAAGEDIRWLPRDHSAVNQLPDLDFWLFDSKRLCILHFDENDEVTSFEVIDDPLIVAQHCQWRDIAWHYATPHDEYTPGAAKRFNT
ncbi:hypothetical protein HNR23_001382 [Nocardiopsis mwathae]|uniref:DUF6879 domain-containing protein n=1 Tax=Nocardiopsis mwathae TaxID=1472723 RepID=A0A7W9YFV1_9ACTN|nr:hypothetical protein [Nocardiopsis mwathae]